MIAVLIAVMVYLIKTGGETSMEKMIIWIDTDTLSREEFEAGDQYPYNPDEGYPGDDAEERTK